MHRHLRNRDLSPAKCGGGIFGFAKNNSEISKEIEEITSAATAPSNTSGYWTDEGRYSTSWSGSGTESDPYLISTAQQLAGLAYAVNSGSNFWFSGVYFKQTADIDLSAYYWQPIGIHFDRTGKQVRRPFLNNYDGNGHTVSGIYTPTGSGNGYSYQGLFGYMTFGSISNLGIKDSNICGHYYVGGVVGYVTDTVTVTECYSTGTVSGNCNVGGVVGYATGNITITKCYNTGDVSGGTVLDTYVGGILGRAEISTTISNCYNTGNITGKRRIGGVVGQLLGEINTTNKSILTNSYNTGTVISEDTNIGGVVGFNSDCAKIINCYNTGYVSGTDTNVGGITGRNAASSSILNCYFGGECTLAKGCTYTSSSPNPVIITKIITLNTTSYAKGKSWYTTASNWDSEYPWDFSRLWDIDTNENNGYPIFMEYVETWEDYAASSYAGGNGTESSPYIIKTPEQLGLLAVDSRNSNLSGKYYKLGANIDLSAHIWSGIGSKEMKFAGNFNGGFYCIKSIKTSSDKYIPKGISLGLFAAIISPAKIENVIMKGGLIEVSPVIITGTNNDSGIIVGNCETNCVIQNCIVEGVTVKGTTDNSSAGGIAGCFTNGTIRNCIVKNCSIISEGTAGGVCGWRGTIVDCAVIDSKVNKGWTGEWEISIGWSDNSTVVSSYAYAKCNGTLKKIMYGDSSEWGNWTYSTNLNGGYPVQKPLFAIGGITGSTNVYNYLKNTLGFAAA